MDSVIVAIDPDPVQLLPGEPIIPIYNDVLTKVKIILSYGIDAVLRIHFSKSDVDRGALELFSVIMSKIKLSELWLGASQTLGRMEAGSFTTISRIADLEQIQITRLPHQPLQTRKVRRLLGAGCVVEAAEIAGRFPTFSRPKSGVLRLAWCPGRYGVVAAKSPVEEDYKDLRKVFLVSDSSGLAMLTWPSIMIPYLCFVVGPGDGPRPDWPDGNLTVS
jgi:hypothetical protein